MALACGEGPGPTSSPCDKAEFHCSPRQVQRPSELGLPTWGLGPGAGFISNQEDTQQGICSEDREPCQELWILTGHSLRPLSGLSLAGRARRASPVSCSSDDLRGPKEAADGVMGDCDADCGILRKPSMTEEEERALQWAGLWAPPAYHSHPSPSRCGTRGCLP